MFRSNGYPNSFVNKCVRRRANGESTQLKPKFWRALPYVTNISEATTHLLVPFEVGIAHRPEATIKRRIMQPKDRLNGDDNSSVIYTINCSNCAPHDIEETKNKATQPPVSLT